MASWRQWIADRFGLEPIRKNALERRVPRAPWYFGDGATLLLLLGVLVGTGMAMTLTYTPSPDGAYESVRYITEYQVLGWFIRGLHYWSAGMMVVMVFFHLFRIILVGGYKFPREGTWLIGVMMFFAVLLMAITGYMLRWDERAIYAIKVVTHMMSNVPWIGRYLVILLQGGAEVGSQTLTRIYGTHVVFVPLLLLGLAFYHVYLVVIKGITSQAEQRQPIRSVAEQHRIYKDESESEETGETFYPETVVNSGTLAAGIFGIVLLLAIFVGPQALYPEANLTEPSIPEEEWWYWWYSAMIALTPSWFAPALVVVLPVAVLVILVAIPFMDRGPHRGMRRRPIAVGAVVVCVLVLLGLSNLRYFSPWTGWPRAEPPSLPPQVQLTQQAEEGRHLFATYGCNSCHAVAGDGPSVGPDLAQPSEPRGADELARFILNPPEGIAMPSYEGRLMEEELDRIVDFVLVVQTFPDEQD